MSGQTEAFFMEQARLARLLLDACKKDGALIAADLGVTPGTVSKWRAASYQCVMPMWAIVQLQEYVGRAIYTNAVSALVEKPAAGNLLDDASQAIEDTSVLFGAARRIVKDAEKHNRPLSPRVTEALHRLLIAAEEDLGRVEADLMKASERV